MKRTRIGGSLAAVANKHGIGRPVAKFPPVAMLTDEERAQALAVMRKGRAVRRDAREKEVRDASEAEAMRAWDGKGMAPGNEPAPTPVATEPVTSGRALALLNSYAATGDGVRSLLLSIAKDERVPADVRLRVFEALT